MSRAELFSNDEDEPATRSIEAEQLLNDLLANSLEYDLRPKKRRKVEVEDEYGIQEALCMSRRLQQQQARRKKMSATPVLRHHRRILQIAENLIDLLGCPGHVRNTRTCSAYGEERRRRQCRELGVIRRAGCYHVGIDPERDARRRRGAQLEHVVLGRNNVVRIFLTRVCQNLD